MIIMRKLLAAPILLLPVIYFYALQVTDSESVAEAQSVTSAEEIIADVRNLSHTEVDLDNIAVTPSADEVKTSVKSAVPQAKKPLRRKVRKQIADDFQKAPKLVAEKSDVNKVAKSINPKKTPVKERNFSNPKENRWIKGSDAELARFGMSKKSSDDECSNDIEDCAQRRKDQSVSLVGVVVKTDRLISNPTSSLDGDVKQGNYNDYLPGLYVK
jgi:hypothetical protein